MVDLFAKFIGISIPANLLDIVAFLKPSCVSDARCHTSTKRKHRLPCPLHIKRTPCLQPFEQVGWRARLDLGHPLPRGRIHQP